MADLKYNQGKKAIFDYSLIDGNVKVALFTDSYSPDIDADEYFDDISANEVTSGGYVSGGTAVLNPVVTVDDANDKAVFDGDDTVWVNTQITGARYAVAYYNTGTPSTSPLLWLFDFGSNKTNGPGDNFTIEYDASGIAELS